MLPGRGGGVGPGSRADGGGTAPGRGHRSRHIRAFVRAARWLIDSGVSIRHSPSTIPSHSTPPAHIANCVRARYLTTASAFHHATRTDPPGYHGTGSIGFAGNFHVDTGSSPPPATYRVVVRRRAASHHAINILFRVGPLASTV